MQLDGKVAVVTGASSGIGAATAKAFAAAGAKVIVGYNTGRDRAEAVAGELNGAGHNTVQLTLEDGKSVVDFGHQVSALHEKIDILVNSAGFTVPVPHANLDALTDELFDRMLAANVRGPFSVIRALAPLLKASGDGVIVNMSSVSAYTGTGSSIAYCASKAALETMTISLARVLGPQVRVMTVAPGAVATDFVAGRDRAALEQIATSAALKRVIEPEDVATAIMACVTGLKTTTGARIVIDGGRSIG
jgi:3-oxoacyl-[acyl-carrier protein] reductase